MTAREACSIAINSPIGKTARGNVVRKGNMKGYLLRSRKGKAKAKAMATKRKGQVQKQREQVTEREAQGEESQFKARQTGKETNYTRPQPDICLLFHRKSSELELVERENWHESALAASKSVCS